MAAEDLIAVEVVFALADRQELIAVTIPADSTVRDAIEASAIASRFPDQDLSSGPVGIWGRRVERDHRLKDGDRVELYRPLKIDPREARRQLAAEGRSMGRRDGEAEIN